MNTRLLWFGPLAALLFVLGTSAIGVLLPGYSMLRQDVSELGALGTPTRLLFAVLVSSVALSLLLFALGLAAAARRRGRVAWPALLILFVVLSEAGIAIFAIPHPLHEPFGLLSLIGFQVPGLFALTWRGDCAARWLIRVSWCAFGSLWLSSIFILGQGFYPPLADALAPVAGLVQRSLFLGWFGWCAFTGYWLAARSPNTEDLEWVGSRFSRRRR